MGQDWYEVYARKFGGYRKLWDSTIEGQDGESAFTALLRQTVPDYPRVLDVGCGDGIYTLHLSALADEIAGIDFAPEMIALARRYQQSAAIGNARFEVLHTADAGTLPFPDGSFDLIYSRRGPSSHLRDAYRLLRPGGLVAGIHTGARDVITARVTDAGFRLVRNEEYHGQERFPNLENFALFLTRMPGAPDYTLPEHRPQLEEHARKAALPDGSGYAVDRWWFIWVGAKD